MSERPSSVKEQAARMILGEIAPLVEKLDQVATMTSEAHEHMADDLRQLAAIVTSLQKTVEGAAEQFGYLTAQARSVQATVARFESAPAPKPTATQSPVKLALLMAGAAFFAAVLAAGGVLVFERSTAEQARIGRAVSKAYQQLDDNTRQKLDAAIRKAGA